MTLDIPHHHVAEGDGLVHHSHPKAWKWYHYFTFNTDHKVIGIQYLVTAFLFIWLVD